MGIQGAGAISKKKETKQAKEIKGQAQRLTSLEELVNFVGRWGLGWVG